MSILRSATRFDQENWCQMEIDKDAPSCEVTGVLDGEPVEFSGGGNSPYTLITSKEVSVSTTSTTSTVVDRITFNRSDWIDKALFVVIRDKAGIRDGYFAYSIAIAMIPDTSSYVAILAMLYRCENNKLKFITGKNGIYVSQLSNTEQTSEITVSSKYDSSLSGTIDGTYVIEVYALDYPPNGVFNL